ncbi:GIY-YIG nuclease family protein [Candidatus Kaiserbacteria bacterium]|nr:GIY-YIG nuclease family protein [Candidatus Kaiserbacteria bacterium]
MPFVYILQFPSGKFYVGSTEHLENRMKHHAGGHTPSTKRLGEKRKLVLVQEYETLNEARSVERKLKKLKRHDYIAKIVQDGYIKIVPQTPA